MYDNGGGFGSRFCCLWWRGRETVIDLVTIDAEKVVLMADWLKIKTEYITTDTSYRKLAEKYGLSRVQVGNVGKEENWVELRRQYLENTLTKTLEKTAETDSDRLARLMETTSRAIDVVVGAFEDEKQFNRYLVDRKEKYTFPTAFEDENGEIIRVDERQWTEERVFAKVDTKALRDLTTVLKDLTGLMRDFYNIPTPAQAEAQRIAAARLEMDRRRAEAWDDDVNEIAVTFDAGEEAWNE